MKNRIMMILAVGMLMACLLPLAALAQQQEWHSTSTMQGSGSAYSSQVTAVGAASVGSMATTTSSGPARVSGPRRSNTSDYGNNPEVDNENHDTEHSPLGDAVLPLLLMAAGFGLYTVLRRRKETA